ncbi:BREX-2 system adenine-specific DNA-methyltransferase PglX [Embleya sp. NPDC056575]|uniref:BREX-2 system adenine-specific DNA-methyltransferase PglX n=1 Tax=unclassified Embleya TaxID=2699296 RepID=UPI003698B26D
MIDRKALLDDLKQQVKAVEIDLGKQVKALPDVKARLDKEYRRAREVGRTGATWNSWLDERITQVAAAWVLGTVFVRFCEDNLLIPEPYLTGPSDERRDLAGELYLAYSSSDPDPTYRGWMERAFAEIGEGQAGQLLFNPERNPLYQVPLSHEGARELMDFWQKRDAEGVLVHDFTDPLNEDGTEGWGTRFLGDLYQDLSEAARKTYALLQTPEFVEEFILDRTMNPVVRELGGAFGELKMIDPTCGSGHFVLGAFRRMTQLWAEKQPFLDRHERVRAALNAVHGVDINPFAVAIARFRLLIAAMAAVGIRTLGEANKYEWPIHLAVGDSLIKARQLELPLAGNESGDALADFAYATEDIHDGAYMRILEQRRYHVVVGNPPYITVKDKSLNELYRELYSSCTGKYALSVPFAERFFQLAKTGDADGRGFGIVGQITANSFMKREFGKKLIEEFFRYKVELTEVIDTSGAYIPGHGTPTVILIGRQGQSGRADTVRTVRSIQGEPIAPANAREGRVWRAIVKQIDQPGSASPWVSVEDLNRKQHFDNQPWSLTDGGLEIVHMISEGAVGKLSTRTESIGSSAITGDDDIFTFPRPTSARFAAQIKSLRPLVEGDQVRDWDSLPGADVIYPLDADPSERNWLESYPLWQGRSILRKTLYFAKTKEQRGIPWSNYAYYNESRLNAELLITFAFVATHNHFALGRSGKVFKQSAPVIKLPDGSSEEEYLQLLGLLNSSTTCFWLKQRSHNMGSTVDSKGARQGTYPFENFYQFNSTQLGEFPLPPAYPTALASALDGLAQELSATSPIALDSTDSPPTGTTLRSARNTWEKTRARMISLQEELDWQVYNLYKLHPEDLRASESDVPELALGERAFEILMARQIERGQASGEWFKRHGSMPKSALPSHWSDAYKVTVQRRIEAIENFKTIRMIERPEYKRRWVTEGWDSLQERALREWLLNRMESRYIWYQNDEYPNLLTSVQLADELSHNEDFVSVAGLYAPHQDLPSVVASLLADEHVPFLAVLRYKPAGLKKRADWEQVWELQRQEDSASNEAARRQIRDAIPVPPNFASTDFLKPSYWRVRGKLDVPKERFISYSSTSAGVPGLFGWAGWNHLEQAQALTTYFTNHTLTVGEVTPLLAGLLEMQPWLDQRHSEFDPVYGGSPAAFFAEYRSQIQGENGLTDDDLRAWRPPVAARGRSTAKK